MTDAERAALTNLQTRLRESADALDADNVLLQAAMTAWYAPDPRANILPTMFLSVITTLRLSVETLGVTLAAPAPGAPSELTDAEIANLYNRLYNHVVKNFADERAPANDLILALVAPPQEKT